ncbi:MAG: carboxypeptidase-like regulatory domain-containing protein [Planctomycetaceae bacterium]
MLKETFSKSIRLLVLASLCSMIGCGAASDKPETGEVKGVVTLDGQPLPEARIVFAPVDGGQSSEAISDAQGNYELTYRGEEKGAKVGSHKVHVSTFEEAYPDDSGKMIGGQPELVPQKYNTNTELTVEVKPGPNDVPLELTQ